MKMKTQTLRDYRRPAVAVDIVVLTIVDATLKVLLIDRDEEPFRGMRALPGGFVRIGEGEDDRGEDLDDAARRELTEETGLPAERVFLEQLYTFGRADRDPRMRVISVVYYALVRPDLIPLVRAGGDAARVGWFPIESLDTMQLAFDHREMVTRALDRIAGKLDYSDVAFNLVPETFTIPELRSVHAIVKRAPQDAGNFRRRFHRLLGDRVIERAPGKRITASKPATVYRFVRARA